MRHPIPFSRCLRHGLLRSAGLAVLLAALLAVRAGDAAGDDTLLTRPLTCHLQAISVGQFHGPDYGPGVPSGSSVILVATSPADLRLRRAVLIEQDRAGVARIVWTDKQVVFVETGADGDTSILSLFVAARSSAGVPAVSLRQKTIGNTPVLVESTGSCRS